MRRIAWVVLVAAGCYREGSAPPLVTNTNDPLVALDPGCRRGDDLDEPPLDVFPGGRLRSHQTGRLSSMTGRTWKGIDIPGHIPRRDGTLELFLLDTADGGHLAFYREPYELGSCTLGGKTNCAYKVEHYDASRRLAWSLPLAPPLLSRPDGLEVQDIRLANGVLYFNEACQSYSAEQQGRCSSLVAVDPRAAKVLWRTPSLVSNGRFTVRGCYLVAGYGFTAEPDNVFLVARATGTIVQTLAVSSAPSQLALVGRERLDVTLYSGVTRRYRLDGIETHRGRLVELDGPEPIYGGLGYGGAAYGGLGYGGATYGRP